MTLSLGMQSIDEDLHPSQHSAAMVIVSRGHDEADIGYPHYFRIQQSSA
jgi:hypothetical protein